MFVDPGAAQAVVKQLNKWYRKQAKPHGLFDHYHRGIRMNYSATFRRSMCFMFLLALSIACVLYFIPGITEGKTPAVVLLLKIGWGLIIAAAFLLPLYAYREGAIITEDEVIKLNVFGSKTHVAWKDIQSYRIKIDENKVTFITVAKVKLTLSLAYDGWQDFLEMAAKRMNAHLYWQFAVAYSDIKSGRKSSLPAKETFWNRPLFKRKARRKETAR